jgi:hypothetical protein
MILKDHFEARVRWGVYRAAEASSPANEAGFGSTAVRPKDALSGAGGAGAAGGRAARGAAAEGRSTAASEQTRMACSVTATDKHAEKGCSGAGGAGAAGGRSTAATEQTRVMQSKQLERIA